MTALLKNGRTLQLHDPSVAPDVREELRAKLVAEGMATFDPLSQTLLLRCAEDTYITVSKVSQHSRFARTSIFNTYPTGETAESCAIKSEGVVERRTPGVAG